MISWIIFDAMGVVYEEGDDTNNLLIPFILNILVNAIKIRQLNLKKSICRII